MSEEEKEEVKFLISRCNECKFATCENCEINWKQVQAIEKLQKENDNLNKKNKRYEKYLKNKDIEQEKVLEYIETEKERDYISKDKIREYIKGNKRVYEMQTPNRNRVIYKDCVSLTSEAKELLGE